jgi:NAD-dependent dihydropyrimidine dehydrogenase PreA subunit
MPYVITEPCINCKDSACVSVCPCGCIHPREGEEGFAAAQQLFINPDDCIHCGLCVDECPVKAIYPEEEVPPKWHHFIQLNASHFLKKA